jgi:glycosyltransferase involved in cell wall biosynthesis
MSMKGDSCNHKKIKIVEICAIDSTMNGLLRELNTTLKEEGFDLIGICSKMDCSDILREEGFNIININIDRAIRPFKNLKSIFQIYKVLKKEKPEVVHVHTPVAAVLGRIAAKLARVPVIIYTAHGFYFHENMKPLVYKVCFNIEKYMARWFTSYIFTQSTEDAQTAIESRFLPKEKIIAIGNGVDVFGKFNPRIICKEDIDKLNEEFNIDDNTKVITFVGRLVKEKGVFELLEAFNGLNKENVRLLIVGDASISERDLTTKDQVSMYKENKNIIFTGRRTDVNKLLCMTDIFCLPSYREGMPRSIIEAMAMECAVVATNIRGCREEVLDGETGFLVKLKEHEAIREKLQQLLEDEELLNKMKIKGRQRAEELYDEKKVVRLQLDIIEKLVNKE